MPVIAAGASSSPESIGVCGTCGGVVPQGNVWRVLPKAVFQVGFGRGKTPTRQNN